MRAFTPILTARQMRRCDAYTIRETGVPSHILMERAAAALVRCIDSRPALFPAGQVLILCGGGNNGGDGIAAARLLREAGFAPAQVFVRQDDVYSEVEL